MKNTGAIEARAYAGVCEGEGARNEIDRDNFEVAMLALSRIIQQIPPSPTIAAAERAGQLKAQGRDIIAFTVGEPDFNTPEHICAAAIEAMSKGQTRYTAAQGILPLRQVIADKVKRDQGTTVSPKQVIVTNGGKQALAASRRTTAGA